MNKITTISLNLTGGINPTSDPDAVPAHLYLVKTLVKILLTFVVDLSEVFTLVRMLGDV